MDFLFGKNLEFLPEAIDKILPIGIIRPSDTQTRVANETPSNRNTTMKTISYLMTLTGAVLLVEVAVNCVAAIIVAVTE